MSLSQTLSHENTLQASMYTVRASINIPENPCLAINAEMILKLRRDMMYLFIQNKYNQSQRSPQAYMS